MEELLEKSHRYLEYPDYSDREIAMRVALWSLQNDSFDDLTSQFAKSGLTLEPFLEVVSFARDGLAQASAR